VGGAFALVDTGVMASFVIREDTSEPFVESVVDNQVFQGCL
jgi:hypothetical protein